MDDAVVRVAEPGGLAGHLDGFVRAVREAGIPVGISQAVDDGQDLGGVDGLADPDRDPGLADGADEPVQVPGQAPGLGHPRRRDVHQFSRSSAAARS